MEKYDYLKSQQAPQIFVQAYKLIGTQEIVGKQHNPVILGWAKEIGLGKVYTNDEIAWCGLFVAVACYRAGLPVVRDPLWARNWLNFGVKASTAMFGDVLVFERAGGGGHVAIYVGEDETCYHILGGNQSNKVNVTRILKNRLIGIRRTDWKIAQPENVKPIKLTSSGIISQNEA